MLLRPLVFWLLIRLVTEMLLLIFIVDLASFITSEPMMEFLLLLLRPFLSLGMLQLVLETTLT